MSSNTKSIISDLNKMKVNPRWAKLPLFDRSKWQTVRFGDVVENLNETCDPQEVGDFTGSAFSIIMWALVSLRMGSLNEAPLCGASGYPAIAYTLDPSAFLISPDPIKIPSR